MRNYLTEHALQNLWCEPTQDRQYIIQPARYTLKGGALNYAPVGWIRIPLPVQSSGTSSRFFHLYQIGQIPPDLLNIAGSMGQWYTAEGLMETHGVLIDVYLLNGTKVPPAYVYFMQTRDKNVLMAIENVTTLDLGTVLDSTVRKAALDDDDVYVRFYSNKYYDSADYTARNSNKPKINVVSQYVTNSGTFGSFGSQCTNVNNLYDPSGLGASRYYIDGFEVSRPTAYDPVKHRNKMFTMIRDTSIEEVANFGAVQDLPTFMSNVDAEVTKYILMGEPSEHIKYYDDIDFVFYANNAEQKGVLVPTTDGAQIRQLLHNAWSLRGTLPSAVQADHPSLWANSNAIQVRAYVRTGGMRFGLIQEAHRMRELIKLSRAEILGALTGVSALVDAWRAENLEDSAYVQVMGSSLVELENNLELISEAYGYNAATKLMSDPVKPIIAQNGQLLVETPPAARLPVGDAGLTERAIFSYDPDGMLVNSLNNQGDYDTLLLPGVGSGTQAKAEVFPMLMSATRDGTFYAQNVETKHLASYGFRCYVCPLVDGTPTEDWSDITETGVGVYYSYNPTGTEINGYKPKITWDFAALATAGLFPCAKVGGVVYVYTPPLATVNYPGVIRFSVNVQMPGWPVGTNPTRIQKLQPGVLDVFMDGESLIENIDYYVNWPEICIVRRPPRTPAEGLKVYARLHGFCNPDTMERFPARETGFVKGGILSVDGEYDIRNDRAIRIVVGGKLMRREEIRFVEDGVGPVVTDGRPYSITDYQMPVEGYTTKKTVPFQAASLTLDAQVAAYLDLRKPEVPPSNPAIIGSRWQVYSPFFSAILHAFSTGFLGAGQLDTPYDSLDITAWVAPYAYLLDYDPCTQSADLEYIDILPHQYAAPRQVTEAQFAFLHKINLQFLGGKVPLSPGLTIGA